MYTRISPSDHDATKSPHSVQNHCVGASSFWLFGRSLYSYSEPHEGMSAAESDECWPYHLHGGNAAMHKAGMPTHALRISTRPIRVEQANIPVLHRNRLEPGINRNPVRCPLGSEAAIADGLLHAIAGTGVTSSVITLKPASVHGPNEVTIATSVASRPRAIRMRPMRGWLWRASNVYQRPPR